jgi:mono/diheme cytochrome c family protein
MADKALRTAERLIPLTGTTVFMAKFRIFRGILLASVIFMSICIGSASVFSAQSVPAKKDAAEDLPKPPSQQLNPQQLRGGKIFMQSCSVCHLRRKIKNGSPYESYAPDLSGQFKSAAPAQEQALREFILKGTQRMPGYQYFLDSRQIDDLVAFLRTL